MQHEPEIVICADTAAVQHVAAKRVLALAQKRVATSGTCTLAISGGNTPRGLYTLLAAAPFRDQIPWQQMFVLWVDERYVPPDDPDSNYRLARETLLDSVPIPPAQIFPMPTSPDDPQVAAATYTQHVQAVLAKSQGQLDLVLLGIGPDGHTASLFPQHPGLNAPADALVIAVENTPKPPPRRLTLTATAINGARHVMFLVTGRDKAETVQAILCGPYDPQRLPAQLINPSSGTLIWLLDTAAGALLQDQHQSD